jgi:serine/threonine protein kinase
MANILEYPKDLVLLVKTRNEIYLGRFNDKHCIYKFTNDNTIEPEILTILNKNILNSSTDQVSHIVPKLYLKAENVTSPTGKSFKLLIIEEYITGLLLEGIKFNNEPDPMVPFVRFQNIPKEKSKLLFIEVIKFYDKLHKLGISHRDDILSNLIISENWLDINNTNNHSIIIIDFGQSFFLNNPPNDILFLCENGYVTAVDIFNLISLGGALLGNRLKFPDKWESLHVKIF